MMGVAVTQRGDVYRNIINQSTDTHGAWFLDSNVFARAGAGAGSSIVALFFFASGLTALASDGTLFDAQASVAFSDPLGWTVNGNVFQSAGHTPSREVFVTGGNGGSQWYYAVASNGDVYLRDAEHTVAWTFMQTLPVGATVASLRTWGQLKARYR